MQSYPDIIKELIEKICATNEKTVHEVVQLLKSTIDQDGLLYVFGSGHSSLLAEEAFHRAGGLIPVYPIFPEFLTPHTSPKISGKLERLEGVASILYDRAKVSAQDCMFLASNSGINAVAVEMAQKCNMNKVPAVAFTSLNHSKTSQTRSASGKRLFEVCDFVLDNCCPKGDAVFTIANVQVAAASTISNSFLYHWILTELCKLWTQEGKDLPIYKSANLPGSDAYNEKIEQAYRSRISLL